MKQQIDQKKERAPLQAANSAALKAKEARDTRIKSHNAWPLITVSHAEREFSELIDRLSPGLFLSPYQFTDGNVSSDFHRHLGMLIDSLEMLPSRPDHAFDICFRIVDELSQQLTGKGTITDALSNLGSFVCNSRASKNVWGEVINQLCRAMPPVSGRYLAQRLLDAIPLAKDPLKSRATEILGIDLCTQLHKKYRENLVSLPSTVELEKETATANNRAGELLCHLFSLRTAREPTTEHSIYPKLDLSVSSNLLNEAKAMSCLISLLAYTARNERVHGSSLSPFRSSKASLTTYASYYFQFHLIYAVAVGLMIESFPGCGSPSDWKDNVTENLRKYAQTFGRYARKP